MASEMTPAQLDEFTREVDCDSPCSWDLPGMRRALLEALAKSDRGLLWANSAPRDFACKLCVPQSDMLHEGFTCAWHEASARQRERFGCDRESCAMPGPGLECHCLERQGFRFASDSWCTCSCHHASEEPAP